MTETLHADIRRVLRAIEALLEQKASPVTTPIKDMLVTLNAIEDSLNGCAIAMQQTADATRELAERPDMTTEIERLHARLDQMETS